MPPPMASRELPGKAGVTWRRTSGIARISSVLAIAVLCCGLFSIPVSGEGFRPRIVREHWAKWYAKHLKAMGEPFLWELAGNPAVESYRLLWLRSFHRPVAIRVELAPAVPPSVIVRVLDGKGGYRPGSLEVSRERPLTSREIRELRGKLGTTRFWDLPPSRTGLEDDGPILEAERLIIVCTDGAVWILEGIEKGRYHLVDWSCLREGEAPRVLGEHFLHLSGIDFKDVY